MSEPVEQPRRPQSPGEITAKLAAEEIAEEQSGAPRIVRITKRRGSGRKTTRRPERQTATLAEVTPIPTTTEEVQGMEATQTMLRDMRIVDTLDKLAVAAANLKDRLHLGLIKVTTPGSVLGGVAGAAGIELLGEHDQTTASLIAALDEPAAAAIFATIMLGKKIKEIRGNNDSLKAWIWEALQRKSYELQYRGARESVKHALKPIVGTAAILALSYVALDNEALAEPINLFLGGSMGALLGAHAEGVIRGRESISGALGAYAKLEFPQYIHDAEDMARKMIIGPNADVKPHHGRGGSQGDSAHHRDIRKHVAPGKSTGGRNRF